jgi:hypothetical protein
MVKIHLNDCSLFSCNNAPAFIAVGPLFRRRIYCDGVNQFNVTIARIRHSQTARMASSKTVFSPFCVRAEHSRYFTAPISLDMATPCEYWIGAMRLLNSVKRRTWISNGNWIPYRSRSFSIVAWSSRKSSLVPTRTTDVCGA